MGINGISGFGSSLSISLSGLRDANLRIQSAAHNIANINTDHFIPSRVSSQSVQGGGVLSVSESSTSSPNTSPYAFSQTSLVDELVNTIVAKQAFEANAIALKTESENQKTLIDTFG